MIDLLQQLIQKWQTTSSSAVTVYLCCQDTSPCLCVQPTGLLQCTTPWHVWRAAALCTIGPERRGVTCNWCAVLWSHYADSVTTALVAHVTISPNSRSLSWSSSVYPADSVTTALVAHVTISPNSRSLSWSSSVYPANSVTTALVAHVTISPNSRSLSWSSSVYPANSVTTALVAHVTISPNSRSLSWSSSVYPANSVTTALVAHVTISPNSRSLSWSSSVYAAMHRRVWQTTVIASLILRDRHSDVCCSTFTTPVWRSVFWSGWITPVQLVALETTTTRHSRRVQIWPIICNNFETVRDRM